MGFWTNLYGTLETAFRIGKDRATLSAAGLTAARTQSLPNKSGTFAMLDDIPLPPLAATLDLYVRTDGNDSNDGSADTAGNAFLTIQRAVDEAYKFAAYKYRVVVHVADGTYAEEVGIHGLLPQAFNADWLPALKLVGNTVTPSNVVVSAFHAYNNTFVEVAGFKTPLVQAVDHGKVYVSDLWFSELRAIYNGYIECDSGTLTLYGKTAGGQPSINLFAFGKAYILPDSFVTSGTNNTGSSPHVRVTEESTLWIWLPAYTNTATGKRFEVYDGGRIFGNNDLTMFPGDAVGTITAPGTYYDRARITDLTKSTLADADKLQVADSADTIAGAIKEVTWANVKAAMPKAFSYTFSTTITDADPGAGVVRFNHATIGSVTNLFFDNTEAKGSVDVTGWLDSLDDATGSDRGKLILIKADGTPIIFTVTGAVTDGTGYRKVPVAHVAGTLPANAEALSVWFQPKPGGAATAAAGGYSSSFMLMGG